MIQGCDLRQARIHLPCLDTIISDLNCKLGYLDEDIALINLIWQGSTPEPQLCPQSRPGRCPPGPVIWRS